MKQLMKLQIRTVFVSPIPYIFVFLFFPVLYILCSSFLPSVVIMPGIVVTIIAATTFFIFGSSLMQLKNSIVYKRLESNGLSKGKFILSNGILSVVFSVISVYFFFEIFGLVNMFSNWEWLFLSEDELHKWTNMDFKSTDVNVTLQFNIFFVDDIFATLDDAVYLLLLDELSKVSDFDNLLNLIDKAIVWDNPNWSNNGVISDESKGDALLSSIKAIVERVSIGGQNAIDELYIEFENNGSPIPIVSGLVSPFPANSEPNGTFYTYEGSIIFNSLKLYDTEFLYPGTKNGYVQLMLYTHLAPTATSLVSPIINWDTFLVMTGETTLLLYIWIRYFVLIVCLALLIYSIMIVFVSASNNFEQYMIFSGLTIVTMMLCSGLFLPLVWILSTPMLFTTISLMPTTSLVFEFIHTWRLNDNLFYPAQDNPNPLWSFGYPAVIFFVLIVITGRLLTNENGKLTVKFEHDRKSKLASKINISFVSIAIAILFMSYYLLILNRVDSSSTDGTLEYPSNIKMFVIISMFVLYSLMLFLNIVYLQGKSGTLYRHRNKFAILNGLLLFPIGIFSAILTIRSSQFERGA